MSDSQKPREWTGVKSIVHEWSDEGQSKTIYEPDSLGAVVEKSGYDALLQQALAMREALKRAADNIGPLCIYPEEAAERHGSLETKAAYKALEQFDEFMKDKK